MTATAVRSANSMIANSMDRAIDTTIVMCSTIASVSYGAAVFLAHISPVAQACAAAGSLGFGATAIIKAKELLRK